MDISDAQDNPLETLLIGLARLRRPIREYFAICDSYYQAIRKATPAEIETIDMARRGIHNSSAELLVERLEGRELVKSVVLHPQMQWRASVR